MCIRDRCKPGGGLLSRVPSAGCGAERLRGPARDARARHTEPLGAGGAGSAGRRRGARRVTAWRAWGVARQ
eukprot:3712494-Prymnesium_polylepis.1